MRRGLVGLIAVGVAWLPAPGAEAAAGKRPFVVTFHDSVREPGKAIDDLRRHGGFSTGFRYGHAVKGFSAPLDERQRARLLQDPRVAFIEPDVPFTAASTTAAGETTPPGIRRIGAATATSSRDAATSAVAVLDTGVDLANRELAAVSGVNCINPGTPAQDDNGHGTNVAGIIAARNQGAGFVGVAPGTRVYSVKVLNSRSAGTLSQILCGIDWVTANARALGIGVANLSLAATGSDDGNCGATKGDAQHKAICRSVAAGVTYVASAGNAARDFATTVPAAYPQVLTVTAMSDTDGRPGASGGSPGCRKGEADDRYGSYSNYASGAAAAAHTVSAPGTCVSSTKLGGGTSSYFGTSQAAPHVAGAVALCLGTGGAAGPCAGLAPAQIVARIGGDARVNATPANGFLGDPLRPLSGRTYGPLVTATPY
jgi:subtilisin family serine protease